MAGAVKQLQRLRSVQPGGRIRASRRCSFSPGWLQLGSAAKRAAPALTSPGRFSRSDDGNFKRLGAFPFHRDGRIRDLRQVLVLLRHVDARLRIGKGHPRDAQNARLVYQSRSRPGRAREWAGNTAGFQAAGPGPARPPMRTRRNGRPRAVAAADAACCSGGRRTAAVRDAARQARWRLSSAPSACGSARGSAGRAGTTAPSGWSSPPAHLRGCCSARIRGCPARTGAGP